MDYDLRYKNWVLLITVLSAFLMPFMISSVNIALPQMAKSFHINAYLLSWIQASYLLSSGVGLVPFGRVGDIFGRKKVFTVGIFIFTVATFFSGIASSYPAIIIARVVQGFGTSMIWANNIAIISDVLLPQERGKYLGFVVSSVYFGLSAGPFLGGFLIDIFSWRALFLVNVLPSFIILLLSVFKLKEEKIFKKREKFDWQGSFLYAVLLICFMYGFPLLPSFKGFVLIFCSTIFAVLFYKLEIRSESPVFNVRIFKENRRFCFSNLAALINYSATFAVVFVLSLYLQYIKGASPREAGMIIMIQPIVQSVFSPFAGKLSDKIEAGLIASFGMGLTCLGLFMLSFVGFETPFYYIIICLVILGFGFAFFSSPNMNAIMGSVEKQYYGFASGTVSTMRVLGQNFSMGLAAMVLVFFVGKNVISPNLYPAFLKSVKVSFIIFSTLCFIGVFASFIRIKK